MKIQQWIIYTFSFCAIIEILLSISTMTQNWGALACVLALIILLQMRYWRIVKWLEYFWTFIFDAGLLIIVLQYTSNMTIMPLILILLSIFAVIIDRIKATSMSIVFTFIWLLTMFYKNGVDITGVGIATAISVFSVWVLSSREEVYALHHQNKENEEVLAELNEQLTLAKQQEGQMRDLFILKERDRISRELHDSVGHTLSTLIIQLGALTKINEKDNPKTAEITATLKEFASEGLQEVRQVIHDLKPIHLENSHVLEAFDELFNKVRMNGQLAIQFRNNEPQWSLEEDDELLLYRVAQEFLSNTQKYARATKVVVNLMYSANEVILTMQDNGIGTDLIAPRMGLNNIQKRVMERHGEFQLESERGKGFKIRVVIPKKEASR